MKKLYFVVEKELQGVDDNGGQETTGNKTITMYSIDNNIPTRMGDVDCENETSSEDAINDWLSDNGYGDEDFELKQL